MITNIKDIKTLLNYDEYTREVYYETGVSNKKYLLKTEGIRLKNKDKTVDYYLTLITIHYFMCEYGSVQSLIIYPGTIIKYSLMDIENIDYIFNDGYKYCKDVYIPLCKMIKKTIHAYHGDIHSYFNKVKYYNLCLVKLNRIYGNWYNGDLRITGNKFRGLDVSERITFIIGLHWLLCTNHNSPIYTTMNHNKKYEVCLNIEECAENVLKCIWDEDLIITSKEMYRDLCNVLKYINCQFVKMDYKPFLLPYKYDIDNVKSESSIYIFKHTQIKPLF